MHFHCIATIGDKLTFQVVRFCLPLVILIASTALAILGESNGTWGWDDYLTYLVVSASFFDLLLSGLDIVQYHVRRFKEAQGQFNYFRNGIMWFPAIIIILFAIVALPVFHS